MIHIFTNYIFTGILSGIFAVFLFYLDAKITKKTKSKYEYFKIFIITALINGFIIYIMKMNNLLNLNIIKTEIKEVKEVIESNYPDF